MIEALRQPFGGAWQTVSFAELVRLRFLRELGLSQKLKPVSSLSGKVVAHRVLVAYYKNWHGRNPKLAGDGQPDEILRKEGQSWGSRRDSHEPKTTAVKTIRPGGDAKNAALPSERMVT